MEWSLVVAAVAQIFAFFGVAAYARHAILTEKRKVAEQLRAFVESPAEGKMSPLAELVELVSARMAAHLIAQVKEFMRVQASAVARQEKAIESEVLTEVVNTQNPLLGVLLAQFPSLGKRLMKNPSALPAIMNLFSRGGGFLGSAGNGNAQAEIVRKHKE